MDLNTQKELFSLSYIEAVAFEAGYQVTDPKRDRDSVDGILLADIGRRAEIHFQAKATSREVLRNGTIHFPIKKKNYDDLRVDVISPRILIVLLMPDDKALWLRQTDDELCLRHCAYWMSLEGEPDLPNTSNVTVHVPTANVFSSAQLTDLMERADRGDALC